MIQRRLRLVRRILKEVCIMVACFDNLAKSI
jgi:hypothetical protein